ncbi:DUF3613 domain-containing protein [Burkholderia sp. FERM BP-3421]|uniref:DUF3613 domain-containing protein n=1 Tax=Burkholderia sp. FERM BP-3421 TaxID=1494466 RepID=UPI00235F4054|nr:DUF3613 domain-containing protein [Burkholderia sp. FERM BP-3421]WDD94360.1 DUF3613 domain-containing protein [Burkholderia sp. FERM BP-3421]
MTHVFDHATNRAATRRRWISAMLLAGALGASGAQAQAQPAQAAPVNATPPASEIGHATLAWLDLQGSNRAAVQEQPMLGAAASLAYQRYLDSFKNKIPEFFGSAASSSGGGGSSSSSLTPASSSQ